MRAAAAPRAGIYARVSSKRQSKEGLSLDQQVADARAFIERQGWTVDEAHVFIERGLSGTNRNRPALADLVAAVEAGDVDVLVSRAIDRIGRSMSHTEELFSTFDAHGVDLWSPTGQHYSGDDPGARFTRRVLAAAAELERDMISDRVAAVSDAKAERGSYHGGIAPYGYRHGKDGLEVDEDQARWVRYMFRRYVEGASAYVIAGELAEEGAPSNRGGEWTGSRVLERLDSPIYIGRVRNDQPGKHAALIDDETWRSVRSRRDAEGNLNGNGRGRSADRHLLSHGLLRCSCGATMSPRNERGKLSYRCSTRVSKQARRIKGGACSMPSLPQAAVDSQVRAFLAEHVVSPGVTMRELDEGRDAASKAARKAQADALRGVRLATERAESAETKWIDGKLDDQRYDVLRERFGKEREAAQSEADRAASALAALANPDPDALAAVERLRADVTDADSFKSYKLLLSKLFEGFEIVQAEEGAPATIEDVPMPSFEHSHRERGATKADEHTHRYYLLPQVQPALLEVYNGLPLVAASSRPGVSNSAAGLALAMGLGEAMADERVAQLAGCVRSADVGVGVVDVHDLAIEAVLGDQGASGLDLGQFRHRGAG